MVQGSQNTHIAFACLKSNLKIAQATSAITLLLFKVDIPLGFPIYKSREQHRL